MKISAKSEIQLNKAIIVPWSFYLIKTKIMTSYCHSCSQRSHMTQWFDKNIPYIESWLLSLLICK